MVQWRAPGTQRVKGCRPKLLSGQNVDPRTWIGNLMAAAVMACPSLASKLVPLVDMSAFSLRHADPAIIGNGMIAGRCNTGQHTDYLISYPQFDPRGPGWSTIAANVTMSKRGGRTPLCNYGWDALHEAALHGDACPLMIDVGANAGYSMLPVAARGKRVLAFEPVARNVGMLKVNAFLNGWGGADGHVGLVEAAVSASSGTITLFAPKGREDNSAIGRGDAAAATINVGSAHGVARHQVRTTTLDGYFGEADAKLAQSLRLVKIDTQGHELDVLRGMEGLLRRPDLNFTVVLELDHRLQEQSGHRPEDVLLLMHQWGWKPFCFNPKYPMGEMLLPVRHNGRTGKLPACYDVVFVRDRATAQASGAMGKVCAGRVCH